MHLFKQAKLDVVILEVGLGGRLDATNIVDNDLTVITSIDIDHTDFLGSTREEISFEKAGIFRANKPVVIGEPNVPRPMLEQAEKLHCHVSRRDVNWSFKANEQTWMWQSNKVRLENLPFCQIPLANAATALAAVEQLPFDISVDTIKRSLIEVELVGRFQQLKGNQLEKLAERLNVPYSQLPKVIIDVGHNPHAAKYLAEKLTALKAQINNKPVTSVSTQDVKFDTTQLTQLESANKATQDKIAQVEELINAKSHELVGLQSQINKVSAQANAQQPTDWLFSEADFLLNNALRKLVLDNDVDTAVSLLKLADETLAKVNNSQSAAIRSAINQDLKQLLSVTGVDQNAVMQKLSQLANTVDELPVLDVNFGDDQNATKLSDSLSDWAENAEKSATSFLNHFIRISPKHGADRKELLAPNQDIYLRENIRLRLQLAIMAVPRQQNELYKQSLEAVASWIRSYFDTNAEVTQSFLKSVDELSELSIYVDVPSQFKA